MLDDNRDQTDKASSLTVKEILPRDVPIVRVGRGLLINANVRPRPSASKLGVEPYRLRVVHQDVLARGGCLDLVARRRPVLQPEDILCRDLGVDECVLANTDL